MVSFKSEGNRRPPLGCQKFVAPSAGCFFSLNSVHLVPLLTRSCCRSKVLAGPRSGWKWSSAGYGSLRRSVATVWRFCGLVSPTAVNPLKSTVPTHSHLGLFLWLMELGGCWVGHTPLPPTFSLVVPYLWRPDAESRLRAFLEGVSQGLNTALVPICYLDKWLYANFSLGLER